MPLLSIQTNVETATDQLLPACSALTAKILSKPESYVMVSYQHNPQMLFAGNNKPLAYLEFKSLGLPEQQTKAFSQALCELMTQYLDVPAERVYIEFTVGQRSLWGWNGSTF